MLRPFFFFRVLFWLFSRCCLKDAPGRFFGLSGLSWGLPGLSGTSFLEEFRQFSDFGGGSKSMAGDMF